jgi:hypothetical protein
MIIIGCDYHPGFQQIAFVDTETGELPVYGNIGLTSLPNCFLLPSLRGPHSRECDKHAPMETLSKLVPGMGADLSPGSRCIPWRPFRSRRVFFPCSSR